MPLIINSMNQKKSKKRFMQNVKLRKPLCAAMILCSWLVMTPATSMAADEVAITQNVNQQITVKGTVTDVSGEPIIGASVLIEGTTTGTITDIDGNFSLQASPKSTLVVSFIGFQTLKVPANSKSLNLVLKEDAEVLDEVVVVGYGAVKRANLTGAVSSVKMKDLEDMPSTNLASVLMGAMPGVTIGEATGNPLGTPTLKIRTSGSWNNEPVLYVIDGFIRDADAFNALDPSEVDNISVLKDAQAAVYGVRGAGGVVLVSTKKGKAGKTRISYSGSYGFSQGVSMPKMMSAYEQGVAMNDMYKDMGLVGLPTTSNSFSDDELETLKGVDYNWLDEAWKNAQNTRHTLNVSGGSDKIRYFLGGSYMWADGNFSDLNTNKFNVRSGIDIDFTKELKGSFSINYSTRSSKMPLNEKDAEPDRMYGTFSNLVRMPRWYPAYIDGKPVGNGVSSTASHPLEVLRTGSEKTNRSDDIAIGSKLDYDIKWVKGLKVGLSFNYNRTSSTSRQVAKSYNVYNFVGIGPSLYIPTNTIDEAKPYTSFTNAEKYESAANFAYSYQLNPSISYSRTFGKHSIDVMGVYEQSRSNVGNSISLSKTGMNIDGWESMDAYQNYASGSAGFNTEERRQSYIGRLNYSYSEKYFVEAAARYEASTNFAPGYRWGFFPSVSLGWRISEEAWFKDNVSFMDNFKLRASYGRMGNDKAQLGQWREFYENAGYKTVFGDDEAVLGIQPRLEGLVYIISSWEKTDSYNGGIDMRFLDCLNFSIDGYYKHTFDILDDAKSTFPQSSGVSGTTPKLNYGIQNAWGIEMELGYQKQVSKDWGVTAKANWAWNSSKVIRKYQNPGIEGTWRDENGRIRGGETGYHCLGIARTWEDVENYKTYLRSHLSDQSQKVQVSGILEENFAPGMLMYEDIGSASYVDENGVRRDGKPDGIINDNDLRFISKYGTAPYTYGVTLGFSWKDLRVEALFNGSFGNDVIFDKGFYADASGGKRSGDFLSSTSNQLKEWYGNYCTLTQDENGNISLVNPDAKYPRLDSYSGRGLRSDFWMRDGHTLRLRNLNISYNLAGQFVKKIGLEQLRVFFTGTNLWTIINPYPYKDANVGYWSDYPQIRTFNFGINISL